MNRQSSGTKKHDRKTKGRKSFYTSMNDGLKKLEKYGFISNEDLIKAGCYIENVVNNALMIIDVLKMNEVENLNIQYYERKLMDGRMSLETLKKFHENDVLKPICSVLINIENKIRLVKNHRKGLKAIGFDRTSFMSSLVNTEIHFLMKIRTLLHSKYTVKSTIKSNEELDEGFRPVIDKIYYNFMIKRRVLIEYIKNSYNKVYNETTQDIVKHVEDYSNLNESEMSREKRNIKSEFPDNIIDYQHQEQFIQSIDSLPYLENENSITPFRGIESSNSGTYFSQSSSSSFLLFSVLIAWFYRKFTST